MGNDLPLSGNLAGSNKPKETSFNLVIELSRGPENNKQQYKEYFTFKLLCAVVHLSPEPLQIKTI